VTCIEPAAAPDTESAVARAAPPAVTAAAWERNRRREVSTASVVAISAELFKDVLKGGVLRRLDHVDKPFVVEVRAERVKVQLHLGPILC
jgi:hypothetical protein